MWSLNACMSSDIVIGPHNPSPLPTAPSTMPELIISLSAPDYQVRLSAICALRDLGPSAESAVPALIVTLSDDASDIRIASAEALGEIGPKAALAVPTLVERLRLDDSVHTRVSAAEALGKIGDTSVVPVLASILWEQETRETYISIPIKAAQAIALLTGNQFPDSAPGPHGYKMNEEGVPLIITAAQKWWESEGQYQEWTPTGSPGE